MTQDTVDNTPPGPIFKARLLRTKHNSDTFQTTRFRTAVGEIIPTTYTLCSGPTLFFFAEHSSYETRCWGGCFLASPHGVHVTVRMTHPPNLPPREISWIFLGRFCWDDLIRSSLSRTTCSTSICFTRINKHTCCACVSDKTEFRAGVQSLPFDAHCLNFA